MESTFSHIFTFTLLSHFIISNVAAHSTPAAAVALAVIKDTTTNQHIVNITQKTPSRKVSVTLHLGGPFLWVDCERSYMSSTYHPAPCGSAQCRRAKSKSTCSTCNAQPRPGCSNNTCVLTPENPFTRTSTSGEVGSDVVRVRTTDGSSLGRRVTVPKFLFVCAPHFLTIGLATGSRGIAGLGRNKISLPSQFSSSFEFSQTFAICLSSTSEPGVVIFGDVPYMFVYSPIVIDIRTVLTYTPLLINHGEKSTEYFIGITSIKVNNITAPINPNLLTINRKGYGGTKISTVDPYTVLETSIYRAITGLFDSEIMGTRVSGVSPFEICYDPASLSYSRLGPAAPNIDLVLQNNESVYWRISSTNSLVYTGNVYCLAFIDGGVNLRTSIVIGAFQMQDNLLQFDLVRSRLGFTGSLLFQYNRCDNFNFTSS